MFSQKHQQQIKELAMAEGVSPHEIVVRLATERLNDIESFGIEWDFVSEHLGPPTVPTLPTGAMINVNKTLPKLTVGRVG